MKKLDKKPREKFNLFQTIQKYLGFCGLIAFILLFVYALVMATPIAPLSSANVTIEGTKASEYYDLIQPYNDAILWLSIFGILISLLYTLFRNKERKVYFASNFAWLGVFIGYSLVAGIVSLICVYYYQAYYGWIPFDEVNTYFSEHGSSSYLNPNTPIFIFGYILSLIIILLIVPSIALLVNKVINRIKFNKTPDPSNEKLESSDVVNEEVSSHE